MTPELENRSSALASRSARPSSTWGGVLLRQAPAGPGDSRLHGAGSILFVTAPVSGNEVLWKASGSSACRTCPHVPFPVLMFPFSKSNPAGRVFVRVGVQECTPYENYARARQRFQEAPRSGNSGSRPKQALSRLPLSLKAGTLLWVLAKQQRSISTEPYRATDDP
jgi:hypothetical protein